MTGRTSREHALALLDALARSPADAVAAVQQLLEHPGEYDQAVDELARGLLRAPLWWAWTCVLSDAVTMRLSLDGWPLDVAWWRKRWPRGERYPQSGRRTEVVRRCLIQNGRSEGWREVRLRDTDGFNTQFTAGGDEWSVGEPRTVTEVDAEAGEVTLAQSLRGEPVDHIVFDEVQYFEDRPRWQRPRFHMGDDGRFGVGDVLRVGSSTLRVVDRDAQLATLVCEVIAGPSVASEPDWTAAQRVAYEVTQADRQGLDSAPFAEGDLVQVSEVGEAERADGTSMPVGVVRNGQLERSGVMSFTLSADAADEKATLAGIYDALVEQPTWPRLTVIGEEGAPARAIRIDDEETLHIGPGRPCTMTVVGVISTPYNQRWHVLATLQVDDGAVVAPVHNMRFYDEIRIGVDVREGDAVRRLAAEVMPEAGLAYAPIREAAKGMLSVRDIRSARNRLHREAGPRVHMGQREFEQLARQALIMGQQYGRDVSATFGRLVEFIVEQQRFDLAALDALSDADLFPSPELRNQLTVTLNNFSPQRDALGVDHDDLERWLRDQGFWAVDRWNMNFNGGRDETVHTILGSNDEGDRRSVTFTRWGFDQNRIVGRCGSSGLDCVSGFVVGKTYARWPRSDGELGEHRRVTSILEYHDQHGGGVVTWLPVVDESLDYMAGEIGCS